MYLDNVHIFDTTGKLILNDERFLFGMDVLNFCISWFYSFNRKIKLDLLVSRSYICEEKPFLTHVVPAYFFYGHINAFKFYSKRIRPFYNMSNFALFDVLNMKEKSTLENPKASYVFRTDAFLRDTVFEAQEFVHSFTFEMV